MCKGRCKTSLYFFLKYDTHSIVNATYKECFILSEKDRFEEGTICYIDKDNKMFSQRARGINIGIIIKKEENKSFFSRFKNTYQIYNPNLDVYIDNVPEKILTPYTEKEEYKNLDKNTLIRYPDDIPIFGVHDRVAIIGALKYINGEISDDIDMSTIVSQLHKILNKLEFYDKMKEV